MDSKDDSLLLSYKDNPELKAVVGGLQPGDTGKITLSFTVRANDENALDALIDSVEPCEDDGPVADEGKDDEHDNDADVEEPKESMLAVIGRKKAKS